MKEIESVTDAEAKQFVIAFLVFALGCSCILGSMWYHNGFAFAGGIFFCVVGAVAVFAVAAMCNGREQRERAEAIKEARENERSGK